MDVREKDPPKKVSEKISINRMVTARRWQATFIQVITFIECSIEKMET